NGGRSKCQPALPVQSSATLPAHQTGTTPPLGPPCSSAKREADTPWLETKQLAQNSVSRHEARRPMEFAEQSVGRVAHTDRSSPGYPKETASPGSGWQCTNPSFPVPWRPSRSVACTSGRSPDG